MKLCAVSNFEEKVHVNTIHCKLMKEEGEEQKKEKKD